jgi:hypothetical protein
MIVSTYIKAVASVKKFVPHQKSICVDYTCIRKKKNADSVNTTGMD